MLDAEQRDELEHFSRVASLAGLDVQVALPTSRHFVADGVRIHLLDWGRPDAEPIVLLHGGASNCSASHASIAS